MQLFISTLQYMIFTLSDNRHFFTAQRLLFYFFTVVYSYLYRCFFMIKQSFFYSLTVISSFLMPKTPYIS